MTYKGIVNGEVVCMLYYNKEKGGYWWVHYFHFPYVGTQIYLKAQSLEEAKRDSEELFIQNCKEAVDKYTSMLNACIKQTEVTL